MLKVVDGGGEPASPKSRREATRSQIWRVAPPGVRLPRCANSCAPWRRRFSAAVRAIAGRDAPDVEDIVQETMVAFVQALPAFRGECSVVHYASRIAVRTAMAARKRRLIRQNRAEAIGMRAGARATTRVRQAKTRGPFDAAISCAPCSTSYPKHKPTPSPCASRSATRCKRSPTQPARRSTPFAAGFDLPKKHFATASKRTRPSPS